MGIDYNDYSNKKYGSLIKNSIEIPQKTNYGIIENLKVSTFNYYTCHFYNESDYNSLKDALSKWEKCFGESYFLENIYVPKSVENINEYTAYFNDLQSDEAGMISMVEDFIISGIDGKIDAYIGGSPLNVYYDGDCNDWANVNLSNVLFCYPSYEWIIRNGELSITKSNEKYSLYFKENGDYVEPTSLIFDCDSIKENTFCCLEKVDYIYISENVSLIEYNPFVWSNISSIEVSDNNKNYDSRNSCNAIIDSKKNKVITGCSITEIPDDIEELGEYSFDGVTFKNNNITIPNSVIKIGRGAFYASSLTSITIPNSVTSIGELAFSNCLFLESVIIPNSVTSVEYGAFLYCIGLKNMYFDCNEKEWIKGWIKEIDCGMTWNGKEEIAIYFKDSNNDYYQYLK